MRKCAVGASDPALWKDLGAVLETCRGHAKSLEFDMLHAGSDWTTFAESVADSLALVKAYYTEPVADYTEHLAATRTHLYDLNSAAGGILQALRGWFTRHSMPSGSIQVISDRVGRT